MNIAPSRPLHMHINLYQGKVPPVVVSASFDDEEYFSSPPPEKLLPDGVMDIFYKDIADFDEKELRRVAAEVAGPGSLYFREGLGAGRRRGAFILYPRNEWSGHAQKAVSLAWDCVGRLTGRLPAN